MESYDGRRIKKDLKYPCPSRNWWIVEAVVWSEPKAEAKKQKVLLDAVMAKRSEIMKARMARKKLRVGLGREVKAKVRALKKRQECVDSQFFVRSAKLTVPLSSTLWSAGQAELCEVGQGTQQEVPSLGTRAQCASRADGFSYTSVKSSRILLRRFRHFRVCHTLLRHDLPCANLTGIR